MATEVVTDFHFGKATAARAASANTLSHAAQRFALLAARAVKG
jgi:hypothetical protein